MILFNFSKVFSRLGVAMAATATLLAGCGGGSGAGANGGSVAGGGGGAGPSTTQIQLRSSSAFLSSDAKTPLTLTATVTNAENIAVANKRVNFAVTDSVTPSGVVVEIKQGTTDNAGKATATLSLTGDPSNRAVSVVASVDGVQSTPMQVQVTGTSLAVSGPNALALNAPAATTYTVNLKDSSGNGLAGQPLAVASKNGNTLTAASIQTDASGAASFGVIGTKGGADTLTVSGLGTSGSFDVNVAGDSLTLVLPSVTIPINTPTTLSANYVKAGGIPAGASVNFATTRGSITAGGPITSGTANATVQSAFAGPATITALVGGVVATANVNFVATVPHQVDLLVSPTVIGPNAGSANDQRSSLVATVRDPAGNMVANALVTFSAIADPSGGTIVPGAVLTDLAGRAQATFIAGPNMTAFNGVLLRASAVRSGSPVVDSPVQNLTVSRRDLFVRMQPDDVLDVVISPPLYIKKYAVLVTDASGNGVAGATVQGKLTHMNYKTGRWVINGARWQQQVTGSFPNEDVNKDGVCQAGEDANGDRNLTPGNVAAATPSAVTDARGAALIEVTYPQGFAAWADVLLEVTARSGGTESQTSDFFTLDQLAAQIQDVSSSLPGEFSPFPFTNGRTCP